VGSVAGRASPRPPVCGDGSKRVKAVDVLRIMNLGDAAPALPPRRWTTSATPLACSAVLHLIAASLVFACMPSPRMRSAASSSPSTMAGQVDTRHLVFVARDPRPGGGGGGGGNRQLGPIRHAKGVGADRATLRIAPTVSTAGRGSNVTALPALLLDAQPLASGNGDQVGLPFGGVSYGTSTGPGSGGGVGDGAGTGIGSGRGPGIGPGSGGGIGGGVYRPGGSVTAPRVLVEVKPTYTTDAVLEKIQGTVVLELVVQANGLPSSIRIVRSLDPGGLDEQAIIAAGRWRFDPGRLAGKPVAVLVTVMLDFWIR
jgi:protein TonB